jgi:hypothetical protein
MKRVMCPLTPLQKDIANESFCDLQRLIYKIIWDHIQKAGGDPDDLLSAAHENFLLAHQRYDPNKGELTTYISISVKNALKDIHRKEKRRVKGHKHTSLDAMKDTIKKELKVKQKEKGLEYLLEDVGEDCKNIIYLILFPPQDFYEEFLEYVNPKQWKHFIKEYLHFNMKWTFHRIHKAFDELKEAMSEL